MADTSCNVLKLLRQRQEDIAICENTQFLCKRFKSLLTPRHIPLNSILGDFGPDLIKGHVLLGFSYDGSYLISYKAHAQIFDARITYTLHWWLVQQGKPLMMVKSCNLFEGFTVLRYLALYVCQKDEEHVAVFGCGNKEGCEGQDWYVSILSPPPPHQPQRKDESALPSVHLRYEILPPYPKFNPIFSLQLQGGALLINTGSTVVALETSLPISSPPVPPLITGDNGCAIVCQSFLLPRKDDDSQDASSSVYSLFNSPLQALLPVEVYHNQRPMIEVSLSSDSIEMRMDVCQYCLDIEPWLVSTMDDVFTDTVAASFSSLNDYKMEIVDVSLNEKIVLLLLNVKAESFCQNEAIYRGYYVTLFCEWNLVKNRARLVSYSAPNPISLKDDLSTHNSFKYKFDQTSLPFYCPVHILTNRTVLLTGETLSVLHHHFVPLCIVFTEPDL